MNARSKSGFEYEIEQTAKFITIVLSIIEAANNVFILVDPSVPMGLEKRELKIIELIYDFANRTALNVPSSARQIVIKAVTEPHGERQGLSQVALPDVEAYLQGALRAVISSGEIYYQWDATTSRKAKS